MSRCQSTTTSILLALCLAAASAVAEPFPADAPEHQALTAASPALGDEAFTLREEYWKGALTPRTGRAVRLQFFKRNQYGLFFGVAPSSLPPGSRLRLHVYDSENQEVAAAEGEAGAAALALSFDNQIKTGLYLILMRVETKAGPLAEEEIPAVLFYGWK